MLLHRKSRAVTLFHKSKSQQFTRVTSVRASPKQTLPLLWWQGRAYPHSCIPTEREDAVRCPSNSWECCYLQSICCFLSCITQKAELLAFESPTWLSNGVKRILLLWRTVSNPSSPTQLFVTKGERCVGVEIFTSGDVKRTYRPCELLFKWRSVWLTWMMDERKKIELTKLSAVITIVTVSFHVALLRLS